MSRMTTQSTVTDVKGAIDDIVDKTDLFFSLNELKSAGARLLSITALDLGNELELVYHFEKGQSVINLHLKVPKGDPVQSITTVYPSAFVGENELQDHFNVSVSGLNVDFGGKFLRIETAEQDTLIKPAVGPVPFIKRFWGRCREECPANVNAPKYIRQIAEGNPKAGYSTVIEQAPLPAILGRVCFAPCQEGCRQEKNENPIQIRLLKRFTADSCGRLKRDVSRAKLTGKKIAVIGGGPSGVSCAFYLGMMGHDVTVFEKNDRCGGAMLWGIPKYRLPKTIMEEEIIARFEEAGVEFEKGKEIKSLKPILNKYDAVYISIGATDSYKLGVEGEDTEGVIDFRELLTEVNMRNKLPNVGQRVAVVGGGNSSIDAARVARRLGAANVTLYYRRTEREMPASPLEIHGALQEGVNFEYLTAPVKIIPGEPLKMVLQHMELGEPDESGRRRPVPVVGSDFTVVIDTIIKGIGQSVVIPKDFGVEVSRRGTIVVNDNYETNVKNVYAGGDCVFGPKSVIEALRDGRKAATAIDKSLGGHGWPEPGVDLNEFVGRPTNIEEIRLQEIVQVRELAHEERVKNLDEVELGYNSAEALREATRCWRCDWNE
ncbi:TPA: FAD-dependent oxidoreductase [Candidatus Bathyarchaeota archaeon]|nr:FAD-dependent oxidoreductase [Candidatus Bathyarchaeota archaeon]